MTILNVMISSVSQSVVSNVKILQSFHRYLRRISKSVHSMLKGLQKKWKVSGLQMVIILCTFAIGGSLTGYLGKKIMNLFSVEKGVIWVLVYIIMVTLIWPLAVLVVSIPFGQFNFFRQYIGKIGNRMGIGSRESRVGSLESGVQNRESGVGSSVHGNNPSMKEQASIATQDPKPETQNPKPTPDSRLQTHIAVFASGTGSNAQRIIDRFRDHASIKVSLIVSNNPAAGVLKIAAQENIPALVIEKEQFFRGNSYIDELKEKHIDFIVLAGFLWKIPGALIKQYPGKIINIHPALLPAYGGKGMYGAKVHEAVLAAGDKESGITIHYVDEIYDHGKIIFQARCEVQAGDTADTLAQRIHALEHQHFPVIIEQILTK